MARRPDLAFQDDTALLGPQQSALLDAVKKAGGKDVRANLLFNKVHGSGAYDFGEYDQLVNAARARGLRVQMTLMGAPQYSQGGDQALSARNADPALMRAFASETAKHFKGRVGRYSIWNEPNIGTFLTGPGGAETVGSAKAARAAGRRYRGIYRAGEAGIKEADRSAQVLLGEITSAPNAKAFLQGALGGKGLRAAGVAFHPYNQPNAQIRKMNTWDIDTLKDLQATLGRYGRQGKLRTRTGATPGLYLTEMGYLTSEVPSQSRRAQLMARGYQQARAAGARQFLSYQMSPTVRREVPGQPVPIDAYGNTTPGAPQRAPGWVWDTSLHPLALAAALAGGKPQARAARRR